MTHMEFAAIQNGWGAFLDIKHQDLANRYFRHCCIGRITQKAIPGDYEKDLRALVRVLGDQKERVYGRSA